MGASVLSAAALCCGQLVAAKAAGWTAWVEYDYYNEVGWYRDLTSATWYPAASVVIASVIAGRMPGGRGRHLALPLAAWCGCAVAAGPLQYAQALGVPDRPATAALLAALAGGGIGAAAAAVALRGDGGVRFGLVAFAALQTLVIAAHSLRRDIGLWILIVSVVLVVTAALRTARRGGEARSVIVAGVAGPLLIWSVHLSVGPRFSDHATQSEPYLIAGGTTLMAIIVAFVTLVATQVAAAPPQSGTGSARL
jgi:hypothetical protein